MKNFKWGYPEWRRVCMVTVVSIAAALGASCSTETKPRGGLMLALSTDMSIVKDMDEVVVEVFPESGPGLLYEYDLQGKNTDGTLVEGAALKAMPGTVAIVPPNSGGQVVRIRVTAKSTLDGADSPRLVREAIAKVPDDRVALLEMPLRWLCSGKDGSGNDQVVSDGKGYQSQCYLSSQDQKNHLTCGGGDCVSADIDTNALPDYKPQLVYGGGDAKGNGSACLDVQRCFGAAPTIELDKSDCSVALPAGADPKVLNVAMVLPPNSDGHCLDTDAGPGTGKCYLPLDVETGQAAMTDGGTSTSTVHEGFYVAGDKIYLPKAVCNRELVQGVAVSQSTSCILSRTGHVSTKSKDLSIPVCGPWTGWPQPMTTPLLTDGGPMPDAATGGRGQGGTTGTAGNAGTPGSGGTMDGGPMPSDGGPQLCTSTAVRAPAYYYVFLDRTSPVGNWVLPVISAFNTLSSDSKSAGINFGFQLSPDNRQSMSMQQECSTNFSTPVLPFTPLPLSNTSVFNISPTSFTNLLLDSAMGQSLEVVEAPAAPASRTLVVITAAHDDAQTGCGSTTDLMKQTVSKALADGVSLRPIVIANQADPPILLQGFQVANAPQVVQFNAANFQPTAITPELVKYRDEIARCTYVAPATRGSVKYTVQLASADTTTPLTEVSSASACSTTAGAEQYYRPTSSTFVLCPTTCTAASNDQVESVLPLADVADAAACNTNIAAGGMGGSAGATSSGGAPAACTSDAACSGQTPHCDTSSGRCVQCLGDANCGRGQTCNLATHTCANGAGTTLQPPQQGTGIQIATPTFDLQPGQEVFNCYHTRGPASAVSVSSLASQISPGGQSFTIYTPPTDNTAPNTLTNGGCTLLSNGWVWGAQQPASSLTLPNGVGFALAANQPLTVDMHYINTTQAAIQAHVTVNMLFGTGNLTRAGALVAFNTAIDVPPNGMQTVTGTCNIPPTANFFEMTTNTFKHATLATIDKMTNGKVSQELVRTTDPLNPVIATWSSPNFVTFQAGETMQYSCSYTNTGNSPITVGNSAATNEQCVPLGYYFPATTGITCN
jgi:hypothetical protein